MPPLVRNKHWEIAVSKDIWRSLMTRMFFAYPDLQEVVHDDNNERNDQQTDRPGDAKTMRGSCPDFCCVDISSETTDENGEDENVQ